VHGTCEAGTGAGTAAQSCNLYVRHAGETRLLAVLSGADYPDWRQELEGHLARVSANGEWLVFSSQRSLTGYDNRDARSGEPDQEVYLYHAGTGSLACVSCDPSGARPVGAHLAAHFSPVNEAAKWPTEASVAATVPGWTGGEKEGAMYQPRYLSDTGRVFFDSNDALVSQDVNSNWDVYEYEPASTPPGGEGEGSESSSCGPGAASASVAFKGEHPFTNDQHVQGTEPAGCVGLISSGSSPEESAFMDASETGSEVFFMTAAKLSPADVDSAYDVYDAHACTTRSPCITPVESPPACVTADACRAAPTSQPEVFGAPASATFSGPGNLTPPPPPANGKTAAQIRAERLAIALKLCRKKHNRHNRATCERAARKKYAAVKARAKRASRKAHR